MYSNFITHSINNKKKREHNSLLNIQYILVIPISLGDGT